MQEFHHLAQEFTSLTGDTLDPTMLDQAHRYADLLAEANQTISLTAIRSPQDIRRKHFLDSLSCQLVMKDRPRGRVIDVGTGGGFPGLVLKLLYPDIHLTLVDSVAKKTAFLSHIVQELGLEGVEVLTGRAEELGQKAAHRESYDWAVARAVAQLNVLTEYLLPLVKVGGWMLAQKGETAPAELEAAENAILSLGGQTGELIPVTLPGSPEKRYLVVIRKVSPTPDQYPRRVGIPAKRPL